MLTNNVLQTNPVTILIVDDWRLFLKMAEDIFRREHVNIIKAQCGPEAVELVRNEKPDLVFMDLYMAGGNGDEACKEIKSDPSLKTTPIIIVTSSDKPEDVERCRMAGCDDFIHKPYTREELLAKSRKFLSHPEWSGKRAQIETKLQYGTQPDSLREGVLTDISVGGIFLEAEDLMPIDSNLHLEFRLSQHFSLIQCKGRVAWIRRQISLNKDDEPPGMGIEFTDIKKEDVLAIQEFVAKGL